RYASIFIPDLWLKYEKKAFRIEFEFATELGSIQGSAVNSADVYNDRRNRSLSVTQFGSVLQSEDRLVDGTVPLGLEFGYASGDRQWGVGNHQGRRGSLPDGSTKQGDIDGPRFCIDLTYCNDSDIKNFRFNPDYHVDMILWRQLLGGVTAAVYAKPSIKYDVTEGFNLFGGFIYSRSIFSHNPPSRQSNSLGLEFNVGARYETDDGFFAQFMYGVLFPFAALKQPSISDLPPTDLDTAHALRGMLGTRF